MTPRPRNATLLKLSLPNTIRTTPAASLLANPAAPPTRPPRIHAAGLDVELRPSLDVRLVGDVEIERRPDLDLPRLLRLDLQILALEHDLLLRVDLHVAFLRLDQELLVRHVEGDRPVPALVGDDDLLLAALVVEHDLMTRLRLDHHGRVLVGVGRLHRLLLAVPERADHVRPVRLAAPARA